jgi:hypothetical protein
MTTGGHVGFLNKYMEDKEKEFLSNIRPEYIELKESGKTLTYGEYHRMRMNSYERRYLAECLDDEAIVYVIKYCMQQEGVEMCGQFETPNGYKGAVLTLYLPELLKRLEDFMVEAKKII